MMDGGGAKVHPRIRGWHQPSVSGKIKEELLVGGAQQRVRKRCALMICKLGSTARIIVFALVAGASAAAINST